MLSSVVIILMSLLSTAVHRLECFSVAALRANSMRMTKPRGRRPRSTVTHLRAIKGVIFDMDGTLTPPGNIDFVGLRDSINSIARSDPNYAEIKSVEGRDVLEVVTMLSPDGKVEAGKVLKELEDKCRENMRLTEGALEVLQDLKSRSISAAVVTRNVTPSLKRLQSILNVHGITLNPMIARDTINERTGEPIPPKPNPDALWSIVELWGYDVSEVLMVGDSLQDDVMAANSANVKSVWINTGIDNATGTQHKEGNPDWTVGKISGITAILEDFNP